MELDEKPMDHQIQHTEPKLETEGRSLSFTLVFERTLISVVFLLTTSFHWPLSKKDFCFAFE